MTTAMRDFSFSARTEMRYQRVLSVLRAALKRNGFEVLCELPLDQELERKVGLQCRHCTVLVVWSPFDAYQAVTSDRDGGLLVPFNLAVGEHEGSTVVGAINLAAANRHGGSLGVQVMAQSLAKKVRRVFLELATQENVSEYREVPAVGGEL